MADALRSRRTRSPRGPAAGPAPGELRAKLFMNGRSQAVRLPKEFRLPGTEVSIRREGDAVILEPLDRRAWPRGYFERLAENARDFPADFEIPVDPVPSPLDAVDEP